MTKPPSRGGRPPRPSAPPERNVYRHPDAEKASPTPPPRPSPWQRAGESTAPRRGAAEESRGGRGTATPARDSRPPGRDFRERAASTTDSRPPGRDARPYGSARPAPRDRPAQGSDRSTTFDERPRPASPYTGRPPAREFRGERQQPAPPPPVEQAPSASEFDRDSQRRREVRIYGRAACLAVAHDRIGAIRKLYHSRQRAPELGALLARLAAERIGYRELDEEELSRVAGSQHHEGLVCDIVRLPTLSMSELREELESESGPQCLLALEGVGNPHNFGAILRSAVHFGVRAVLIPTQSTLTLGGAVYRVAEGAAERVEVVRYDDLAELKLPGYQLLGTTLAGDRQLYRDPLPARSVLLFGAEGAGLSRAALAQVNANYAIPGSGRVDSLNVAQAAAVVLGEWWRSAHAGG